MISTPPLGSPTLLLFPTQLERERFSDQGGLPAGLALRELCGFGPIAAAARTSQLLARLKPARVVLIGIAGSYDCEERPIGTAWEFSEVALHGVGVGEGPEFRGPPALGFPQWPAADAADAVEDRIRLPQGAERDGDAGLLLTTCAASDSREQAALRRSAFPEAGAEDMEGFGVALACALERTPLRIVRGISNRVGDRDPATWRIPAALAAARRTVRGILEDVDWSRRS